jgi:large subunit ribosomal protein L23
VQIEIKRVLESLYGLQVAKVNTLNMEGKKKRAKGSLAFYRRPDYKKAYVTLKEPVSLPANLFPLNMMKEAEEEAPAGKERNRRPKQ